MLTRLSNIFISTTKTNATVQSKVMSVILTMIHEIKGMYNTYVRSSEPRILYEQKLLVTGELAWLYPYMYTSVY